MLTILMSKTCEDTKTSGPSKGTFQAPGWTHHVVIKAAMSISPSFPLRQSIFAYFQSLKQSMLMKSFRGSNVVGVTDPLSQALTSWGHRRQRGGLVVRHSSLIK